MAGHGWGHDQRPSWGGKKVGKNPTDRGHLGTKRRVLTDGGVPIGLAGEGANRHDFKLARATIASIPIERREPTLAKPQGMWLDKGYDDDEVRDLLAEFGFTAHIRARGEEANAIQQEAGYKARRWGSNGRRVGCTASAVSWFAGRRKRAPMWRFCIWRVPTSHTDKLAYGDRLLYNFAM
jgi:Transposase DDE domain